jgi:hypothetical protein
MIAAAMTLLAAATLVPAEEAAPATRRGAFAFHYAPVLSDERLAWYSKFELLVTHDPLPPAQVAALHAAGTKVLFYEWSVAFYESRATPWQRSLLKRRDALLHRKALRGGVGSDTAPAWYFDPAAPDLARNRARDLSERLRDTGYDGVFFDTTGFESVHPAARAAYTRRHGGRSYDQAFAQLFVELRRARPEVVLFTNQGYRKAEHYLPHVDWDLTESLIAEPHGSSYRLRPWNDPQRPWSSIHFVLRTMIEPVAARYPDVRFAHLNYSDGGRELARAAMAVARLFDGESFVVAHDLDVEADGVYFASFGEPLAARVDWPDGSGAHRVFERGIVAVTTERAARPILLGCGETLMVPATDGTLRAHFLEHDERHDPLSRR